LNITSSKLKSKKAEDGVNVEDDCENGDVNLE
jgi:hypothetical protein